MTAPANTTAQPRLRRGAGDGSRAGAAGLPRPAPLEWFYLAAGLFLVIHYRWLIDDAFVYFRYVDNLLFVRLGLVYNAGEYVEGFSSPLHCLLLIALRALHLGWPLIISLVGCACFAAFWFLLVVLNRELSPKGAVVLNLPLALLAFNYGANSFFTSGLETPLAHVMAPVLALYLLRPESRPLIATLALAPLARPELALAVGLAAAFACWRRRAFPWLLVAAVAVVNGGWLAFRIVYYADLFPNTFYLKDVARFDQGWRYLFELASSYHLAGVLLGVLLLFALARHRGAWSGGEGAAALRGGERLAMLGIGAAIAVYVARVGGTHVHYWYLAFPLSLVLCSAAGIAEAAFSTVGRARSPAVGAAAMLGVSLFAFALYPPQLSAHPFRGDAEHESVHSVDDALWHRRHAGLQPVLFEKLVSIDGLRRAGAEIALRGHSRTLPGTWCRKQYVDYRARFVHGFGLTDALLARTQAAWMKPGHKIALIPLSKDIVRIQRDAGRIGPGMYRRAVEAGTAPKWLEENLATIEVIERKIYNRHDPLENLRLALAFPGPIVVPTAASEPSPRAAGANEGG